MKPEQARALVAETFPMGFDKGRFHHFVKELLNGFDESKAAPMGVPDAFTTHVRSCSRLGTYVSPEGELADILIVNITAQWKLERSRTVLRDFVAHNLKRGDSYKEAGLVAFVAPDALSWRFSFVRMEYETKRDLKTGKIKPEERLTPARRFSYLVGLDEECHTAQSRFLSLLQNTTDKPTLANIEEAFSVELVTKEFFNEYVRLFDLTEKALSVLVKKDKILRADFDAKKVSTIDFSKKLLGQIVFLYFIQKKGWLGVPKNAKWGEGQRNFLRSLATQAIGHAKNLFNDVLEPLFYETLAIDRGHEAWCKTFECRIPFLNGGLFEPIAGYDWENTVINLPNTLLTNREISPVGDTGTGILDVFDRFNFTVNEAEPLEKEVAIDPEMLGKVFENLIEENRRKGLGAYYTPREIVHYMCQESLVNYLFAGLNHPSKPFGAKTSEPVIEPPLFVDSNEKPKQKVGQQEFTDVGSRNLISRQDLAEWIHLSEQFAHYETAIAAGTKGDHYPKPPELIKKYAQEIDVLLKDITVCDPAIGSGAFPVGMMSEIVRARDSLTPYFNDVAERSKYQFKRHAIQNSLYGVDIDVGAVEIAKLRLWLSLVVDEEDLKQIKPLPNLDYKIVCGNSLLDTEKNLFNENIFQKLEKLKPLLFDETNPKRKNDIKNEIEELFKKINSGKTNFDFEITFSEIFHEKGGFDIIVGNPPYIGEKGNEGIFHVIKATNLGKRFYTRWMDYFYYFFHKAIDIGIPKSIIALITTNYYLTSTGGDNLRKDLKERTDILNLINFNELKIFEAARGQHNIITILKKEKVPGELSLNCVTDRKGLATQEVLNGILYKKDSKTEYYVVKQEDLYEGNECQIRPAGTGGNKQSVTHRVLEKIKANNPLLGRECKIIMGLVSRADKVSNNHLEIDPRLNASKGDGIFILKDKELKNLLLANEDIKNYVRPYFKNSDISPYYSSSKNKLWLLYMKDKGEPIKLSPELKKHFEKFKNLLTKLKQNFLKNKIAATFVKRWLKDGNYFVLFNPKEEFYFTQPKIIAPYRSVRNTFAYNEIPWFASQDVCVILTTTNELDLKYILAFLNSHLCFLWLFYKGKKKGKILELMQKPLSEIPIKKILTKQQETFINLVDKINDITNSQDYKNNKSKLSEVKKMEKKINELFYELYELEPNEVQFIEKFVNSNIV